MIELSWNEVYAYASTRPRKIMGHISITFPARQKFEVVGQNELVNNP